MMKKVLWIIASIVVIGGIVAILANNKKKIEDKNANNIVQKVFPVKSAPVEELQLHTTLSLIGTVIGNNDVNVTAEVTGRVTKCLIKVGQHVNAGDLLFQIDDEVRLAQLKTAEANFDKAQKDSARTRFLVSEKSMSAAQWDQIDLQYKLAEQQLVLARRAYNDTRIKAPISGVVTARMIDVGAMVNNVQNGTIVCNIVDISKVKVKLQVAERDVVVLKEGDVVDVNTEVFPGENFKGTITSIGAKGDEAHTYPVEVTITNNSKNQLRPGMFARVAFNHEQLSASLVIPREAIVGSVRDAHVYVVESGVAHLRAVVLGEDNNGKIRVVSGLKSGESVVVVGQNTIADGASVSVAQ